MFRLSLMPAREGDCILVTYGDERSPRRILIDGGRAGTWTDIKKRADLRIDEGAHFELIVVSHIDRDHIEGILKMVLDPNFQASVGDFWFNGYEHLLTDLEPLGVGQGEKLSTAVSARGWPRNKALAGKAVKVASGDQPGTVELDGGMKLTLLSPTSQGLMRLKQDWKKWLTQAGIREGLAEPQERAQIAGFERLGALDLDRLCAEPENPDDAVPNGSSIAFLAEYEGRTVLFGADAHPAVLESSLGRLLSGGRSLKLDLLKVPHHGSGRNLSAKLLSMINCSNFVISTNGSHHEHPDDVALARIVRSSNKNKKLYFNYGQARLSAWQDPALNRDNRFICVLPDPARDGWLDIDV